MEESQHAKLDTLLVEKLAGTLDAKGIEKGFADFAALGSAVDGLLGQQVELDLVSLEKATGRSLSNEEKAEIAAAQRKAYRYTFLVSGLVHPNFLRTVNQLSPTAGASMAEMARMLS
jgi:hypothetical protein